MDFKRQILIAVLVAASLPVSVRSAGRDKRLSPDAAFWWAFFVPGGGYFYLGERAKGLGYFTATAGLAGWAAHAQGEKAGDEVNTPFVYAQQIHVAQIYLSYREASTRYYGMGARQRRKFLSDQSSLYDLAASPFRAENLINPWVIGFAALGAGLNYAAVRIDGVRRDFWDVREVSILGDRFNRDTGLAVYSAYWIPISLGAAVSEEALFRGMIQTQWEERWGKGRGLFWTSALFGAAHFDGRGESLENVVFAALAGLFLGWRFQERDYRLSESIAEHFWFNVFAGITLFLADPDNNPLGAKVEFSF